MSTVKFHYGIEKRLGMNGVPLCPDDCSPGTQPAMWYHPAWKGMRAVALPSFSEGYVRLNARGREQEGPRHALDTPPTILTLLGAPVPAHFDGAPLPLPGDTAGILRAG